MQSFNKDSSNIKGNINKVFTLSMFTTSLLSNTLLVVKEYVINAKIALKFSPETLKAVDTLKAVET